MVAVVVAVVVASVAAVTTVAVGTNQLQTSNIDAMSRT